jgi:hypothetical protein
MRIPLRSKLLTACAAILISAVPSSAQNKQANKSTQTKPDLSGTWLLDPKKSNITGPTSRWDLPTKVSHHDPEFRITYMSQSNGQPVELDFVYFTDGRGETNPAEYLLTTDPQPATPGDVAKEMAKSKTRWSGNKIVTRSPLSITVAGNMLEFEVIDEWTLSADGKTLTQTSKTVSKQSSSGRFVPATAPEDKRVYNRI